MSDRKMLEKIYDDVEFYQHQIDGVRLMAKMSSVILADDMGLGKSLQALTTAAVDFERKWAKQVLIVCPSYLKWNWAAEIETYTAFTYTILHGTPKRREQQLNDFSTDILVCGYEQLANDLAMIRRHSFDIAIFDEAHMIKERTSKRTKAVHSLAVPRVLLLTGSPVLNRPNELWSLLHRCDPIRFRSYWAFVHRYCVFGGWKNKQIVGTKNKVELRNILSEFMIRRLKENVLDLPEKSIIPIYVEMGDYQQKLYDQITKELAIDIPDSPDPMAIENALVKMLKQKQVAATPATIEGYEDKSNKLDKAVEMAVEITKSPILDENGELVRVGEPLVIFTQFRGVMTAMQKRLDAEGIPLWQIHGDVPNEKRIDMINKWSKSETPGVIMVMLQMATGMNLTAASKAIFLDKLYVPKLNEQAEDRLYRIGQVNRVQIFCLISKGTVEERIERILSKKRHLFKTLIEDVSSWKEMLMKELREGET